MPKHFLFLFLLFLLVSCNELTVSKFANNKDSNISSALIFKSWTETRPSFMEDYAFNTTQFAFNSSGEAVVVGVLGKSIGYNYYNYIYSSHYKDGVWTHSEESTPLETATNSIDALNLGLAESGHVLLTWRDYSSYTIRSMNYFNSVWSSPQIIYNQYSHYQFAYSSNGSAVVTWRESGSFDSYALRYTLLGGWDTPERLRMGDGSNLGEINAVKINAQNDIFIISKISSDLYFSQYTKDLWTTPLDQSQNLATDFYYNIQLILNNSGKAVLAWDNTNQEIGLGNFNGVSWSIASFSTSSPTTLYPNPIRVTLKNNGDAAVAWGQEEYASYTSGAWSLMPLSETVYDLYLKESSAFKLSLMTLQDNRFAEYQCSDTSCSYKRTFYEGTSGNLTSIKSFQYINGLLTLEVIKEENCYDFIERMEINEANDSHLIFSSSNFICGG